MKFGKIKLVAILLVGCILMSGCKNEGVRKETLAQNKEQFRIVTSFYPIYVEVANIAHDVPGVKVINMTKPQTGCLHDYSLTPADLKTLERASVFVVNGAGMESFMNKVIEAQKDLKIIEASKGIELIKGDDEEGDNPHVWVSITDAIKQVENIAGELAEIDNKNAEKYKENARVYIEKLEALKKKMHDGLGDVSNKDIVTFHEAFPYFAKEFNLNIVSVIEREPGSSPTPKELEETINIIKAANIKALFAEPQYSTHAAETIARETGAKVYTLDPGVTGDGSLNSYIDAMEKNYNTLKEALR